MKKSILNSGSMFALVFFCLMLCHSVELRGQNLNASISGTITDPSGAAVPNADMTLRSVSTGTETRVKSGPDGLFNILNLPQGAYDLTVSAQGFRDYVQRGIAVNLNEKIRIDVKLELGEAKQVIEVQADASPLNFDSGEVKGTIAPQTLEELPLIVGGITRSAVAFARLLPGVTSASGDDRRNFETRINGGINEGDEAILDGISIVDGALSQNGIELATTGMPFSPEAISEISILTSNYDPQYGTTSSAVTTAVTKSGTNEYHGSLYEFHRNTRLNARQFGVPKRPRDLENEFGGTIGGPMKIPKIFWTPTKKTYFFVNRTQFYLRGGVSSPILSIPSLKERQGDFTDWVDSSGNLIPVFDPATTRANSAYNPSLPVGSSNLPFLRDQFMGCDGKTPNVICSSDPRLQNSLAQEWFKYLPTPTFSGPLNNYVVPVPRTTTVIADSTVMDIRVDHYWKDRDRFSAVVHYFGSGYDKNTNLPREIDASDHRAPNYDFYDRGSWDHTFNPNLLNSFNIGYNDIYSFGVCEDANQAGAVPKINGVLSHEFPPVIGFQDFQGFGCNGVFGTVRPAWIANDLVTWVKGKHNFKFGGEFRGLQHNITGRGNQSGSFGFSHLTTGLRGINSGNSIASFLLGAVDSANMNYTTVDAQYARQKVYAFHVADTWKITPKFSLNLGIRYDISTPTREKYDNLSFLDPNGSNPGAGGRPGRLVFAGTKWGSASFSKSYPEEIDYKAFAPRVGFAYSVTPNTVVRAGYGVFFLTLSYPSWSSGISPGTDGFNSNISFGSSNGGITPAFLLQEGFPQNFTKPPFIDPTFRNGQSIGLYRPFDGGRPTYTQQWNLTIERQFSKDLYMTAAYVANKGTRILSTVAPINVLDPKLLSLGQNL
ncbi:MAG: hypothetical protein DMG05_08085 [Acidobacteria bacterium]|nr:MAG: hypothetical protein DMG05_08085 [Acidobacteriota bacterium]